MPSKTKSRSQDRKRISSEKHEVAYAGKMLGKNGAVAVRKAKAKLGRTTSRPKVMSEAAKLLKMRSTAQGLVAALEKQNTAS